MTSLGELSVSLRLDLDGFNRQLKALEQQKVSALNVKVNIDRQAIQKQLQGLKIAVDADTTALQAKLKTLKLETVEVAIAVDTNTLNQQLQKAVQGTVGVPVSLKFNPSEVSRLRDQLSRELSTPIRLRTTAPSAQTASPPTQPVVNRTETVTQTRTETIP